MPLSTTSDCLIVGGGVIGLSAAYELAQSGWKVRLLERGQTGKEASWAGAGILPPGSWFSQHPAAEQLAMLSRPLHRELSDKLRDATGIDDQLEATGALYSITRDNATNLEVRFARWSGQGIVSRRLSKDEAAQAAPGILAGEAFFIPDEMQVRNPRRLEALRLACEQLGVDIVTGAGVEEFITCGDQLQAARTPAGVFSAEQCVLAAGAWTGGLAGKLPLNLPSTPIRGQMLLLRCPARCLNRIYHRDGSYLVPRRDGRVLVGSTVEQAGFDKSTQDADIESLQRFAIEAAPELRGAEVEASWAGLRPACGDELPMIGRLPGFSNGWVASGHYRSGLQFAPATAVLVRQLLTGEPPAMDISAFAPDRFSVAAPPV